MCGRYASSSRPEDLVEEFRVEQNDVSERLEPDYNVAPTKDVYAVLSRPPREDRSAPPVRRLRVLRWGLVPSWAKDRSIGSRLINARVETAAQKPSFRRALAARRCILPADGYYEWYASDRLTKAGKPFKQPYFIRPVDAPVLAMAGLYELWRDPDKERDDPDAWLATCTILTTTAPDDLGRIHDRMPMLVPRDAYDGWLDPGRDVSGDLERLLIAAAPDSRVLSAEGLGLEAVPVGTAVNNVRNNGPELVQPLAVEPSGPA